MNKISSIRSFNNYRVSIRMSRMMQIKMNSQSHLFEEVVFYAIMEIHFMLHPGITSIVD